MDSILDDNDTDLLQKSEEAMDCSEDSSIYASHDEEAKRAAKLERLAQFREHQKKLKDSGLIYCN